jgi:hypothetical protein
MAAMSRSNASALTIVSVKYKENTQQGQIIVFTYYTPQRCRPRNLSKLTLQTSTLRSYLMYGSNSRRFVSLISFSTTLIRLLFFKEMNHLTNSFAQLKQAQAKFKACIENVGEIKEENKGA